MAEIACAGKTSRAINAEIKKLIAQGEKEFLLKSPGALHNLGVGIVQPVKITFDGSVGYYCAGLSDGLTADIRGTSGWGLAESMMGGTIVVRGNAGNAAGAAIRGGTIVIHGDAAARAAVSIKGGTVVIGGSCGYMAAFMGQKGTLIVCGDAGEAFADSMYETVCYVGGKADDLGNDAIVQDLAETDRQLLAQTFDRAQIRKTADAIRGFKKIVAGRKLWNFDKRDWTTWREAL